MEPRKAREEVVAAGKLLVETGLIARTWGNVSCRIDDRQFAITPSGMYYETLRPEDVVIVNLDDLSYTGSVKPSSEMGVHAEVYGQKPHIQFVIHTHQANASVAGVMGRDVDITEPGHKEIVGEKAVAAAYGLPGTKTLRKNVADALGRTGGWAVLMAHHGALCFGEGPKEAFRVARALEEECRRYLAPVPAHTADCLYHSRRQDDGFILETPEDALSIGLDAEIDEADVPAQARVHQAIYRAREDIRVIRGSHGPYTVEAARQGSTIKPLLDDFAQIVGISVHVVDGDVSVRGVRRVVKSLKRRNAVLIREMGALCCAGSDDDASAVEMVLEKGCMAYLSAAARDAVKPIAPLECALMRFVYQKKYAKKAIQE